MPLIHGRWPGSSAGSTGYVLLFLVSASSTSFFPPTFAHRCIDCEHLHLDWVRGRTIIDGSRFFSMRRPIVALPACDRSDQSDRWSLSIRRMVRRWPESLIACRISPWMVSLLLLLRLLLLLLLQLVLLLLLRQHSTDIDFYFIFKIVVDCFGI